MSVSRPSAVIASTRMPYFQCMAEFERKCNLVTKKLLFPNSKQPTDSGRLWMARPPPRPVGWDVLIQEQSAGQSPIKWEHTFTPQRKSFRIYVFLVDLSAVWPRPETIWLMIIIIIVSFKTTILQKCMV